MSQRTYNVPQWFKSSGNFTKQADFAYWWSSIGKGLSAACVEKKEEEKNGQGRGGLTIICIENKLKSGKRQMKYLNLKWV